MKERIRILIADDHDLLRKGLVVFINSYKDFELVGEAATGKTAVQLSKELQPDVVLMDLAMPEMDGITATKLILEVCSQIRIIALTSFEDESLVRDAIQAGVLSYVLKTATSEELAQAIRLAYRGESYVSKEIVHTLMHVLKNPTNRKYDLTDREKTVLKLMIQGMTNAEISQQLYLSIPTIKKHVHKILGKLDVPNRTKAVMFAVENKILEDG